MDAQNRIITATESDAEGVNTLSTPKMTKEEAQQKSDEGTTRKSFIIDQDVASEWKDFNKHVPFPSVTLGCALRRFMDDYRSGRITFELDI